MKGENIPEPEVPESFKVLIKEMKSLCLNIELEGTDSNIIDMTAAEDEAAVANPALDMMQKDAAEVEKEDENSLNDIAAELSDLLGEVSAFNGGASDEGEVL